MIETELKIQLDAATEAKLRRRLAQASLREGPVRTRSLVSVYCDTPSHDLASAGIALRLRKTGRSWVQTVKKRPSEGSRGLFAASETERPAPGGRLRLDGDDPDGVWADVAGRANGAAVAAVFETRVKRTAARLRAERGVVEVAIDRGEVIAGALSAPIREAELELVEGEVSAIFDVARALFDEGPVRFSVEPKSARGLRLATRGIADAAPEPRSAGKYDYPADATLEAAAGTVLRDCLAQIADNLVLVIDSDDPEGPHQLRVGLRRLRAAISAFKRLLGNEAAFDALGAEAKRLGRVVGALRDLDVLAGEMVPAAAAGGLDEEARDALLGVIEARRLAVRETVRAALRAPEAVRFVFDLAETIEARGWLAPGDYQQSALLARPMAEAVPQAVDRRWRKVMKRGRRLDDLDAEGLHDLRKKLKSLRYTLELAAPLHGGKPQRKYVKTLKALQDRFGGMNDAATAGEILGAPDAPGRDNPAVQRAVGWVLGHLAVTAIADRAALAGRWRRFEGLARYWR